MKLRMMEVVVITGAIRRAKLHSNHHHQQTNTQYLAKYKFTSNLDAVRLIVTDVDLITAVAGGNTVRKFHSFHNAELVQDRSSLLTEDDHSLDLALHDDDVAQSINSHASRVL